MPLPLAIALVSADVSYWPFAVAAIAIRLAAAYVVSTRVLRVKLNWLLLPLEDLAVFCFWVSGFFGKTIVWRGRRYLLHPDGRFELMVGQMADVPDLPAVSNEA
jgi:hypothetical protein